MTHERAAKLSVTTLPYVLNDIASILLVDDDPILREFGIVNLSTEAVDVEAACDGIEALQRLEASAFDVLLVDLEMPRLDGFGLLERLRGDVRWRELPVIVVTGREDIGAIDRAYKLGASAFTVKPINWRLLSYQIRFVLRARRAEQVSRSVRVPLDRTTDRVDAIGTALRLCEQGRDLADPASHRQLIDALAKCLREIPAPETN